MEKFRISVRSLVEFLLHSGDIDGGKGGMADKEAMQLGSRIHRKIQGSMEDWMFLATSNSAPIRSRSAVTLVRLTI